MLKWSQIVSIGRSRLVQSAYIWLFLVPIAARAFQFTDSPIIIGVDDQIEISLKLPFSWQLFYAAASLFTFGHCLYIFSCPAIVRDFENYMDFKNKGHGIVYLHEYRKRMSGIISKKTVNDLANSVALSSGALRELGSLEIFWEIYNSEDTSRPFPLVLCVVMYAFGLIFIGIVFFSKLSVCALVLTFPLIKLFHSKEFYRGIIYLQQQLLGSQTASLGRLR